MDDLIAFVRARLYEDEAAAKVAANVAGPEWTWKTGVDDFDEVTDYVMSKGGAHLIDTMGGVESEAPHVARHDPARVLREVKAKRAILAAYAPVAKNDGRGEPEYAFGWADGLGMAVRALAAIWDGHPDFRPEWKA